MDGEPAPSYSPPSSINQPVDGRTAERIREEQRLLRKLDIRLVPAIFVIYVMNYVNVSKVLHTSSLGRCQNFSWQWHSEPPLQRRG
jgi:hypothetical protein